LDREQVTEVLEFVRSKRTRSVYVFPLMVFVAHTGARRSEVIRSRVEDLKFADEHVVIREKRKSQKKETYRRVPMSALFHQVMKGLPPETPSRWDYHVLPRTQHPDVADDGT
jgi:integrase